MDVYIATSYTKIILFLGRIIELYMISGDMFVETHIDFFILLSR